VRRAGDLLWSKDAAEVALEHDSSSGNVVMRGVAGIKERVSDDSESVDARDRQNVGELEGHDVHRDDKQSRGDSEDAHSMHSEL
jgi:hypothetical protein